MLLASPRALVEPPWPFWYLPAHTHTLTFCGASCSGTSHSSSEAAGSCMPSNCFSKPMATASAEFELLKEWDLLNKRELMPGISELCPLHIPPFSDPILNSR